MYESGSSTSLLEADTLTALAMVDGALCERVLIETELTPQAFLHGTAAQRSLFLDGANARFSIRLASNDDHRSEASFLVRKMYGWRGYETDDATQPNCITLIASLGGRMLATITVGFDSPAGLAVGALYPEQVERLELDGARLCEFTRLAVDRTEHSKELLAMMFHVAYMYARYIHDKTDLLIEVNPRHARFYNRMLGFRRLGPERLCPRVNAPAVLMWLPLQHAEEQISVYGGHRSAAEGERSLYPLFFSLVEEAGITARLRAGG